MPLYQWWCDNCFTPYEIILTLAQLKEYDEDEESVIDCPNCGADLRKLICPPKIIKVPAWD